MAKEKKTKDEQPIRQRLSFELIQHIKREYLASDDLSIPQLAEKYEVNVGTLKNIACAQLWHTLRVAVRQRAKELTEELEYQMKTPDTRAALRELVFKRMLMQMSHEKIVDTLKETLLGHITPQIDDYGNISLPEVATLNTLSPLALKLIMFERHLNGFTGAVAVNPDSSKIEDLFAADDPPEAREQAVSEALNDRIANDDVPDLSEPGADLPDEPA